MHVFSGGNCIIFVPRNIFQIASCVFISHLRYVVLNESNDMCTHLTVHFMFYTFYNTQASSLGFVCPSNVQYQHFSCKQLKHGTNIMDLIHFADEKMKTFVTAIIKLPFTIAFHWRR